MIKTIFRTLFSEKQRLKLHQFFRKSKSVFLKGNNVYCICCNHTFSKFLNKGNGIVTRENAVCPNCGSLERTRLLLYFLQNETAIFEIDKKILHIAPEDCLKEKFKKNTNYIDADINPNFATHEMDITKINFEDETFDYIICSHVLGHISDETKAISELKRVLKKDGKMLLMFLINQNIKHTIENKNYKTEQQKLLNYGEKDLERLYGNDVEERLLQNDLLVKRIDYRTHFSQEEQIKFSLGDGNREFIYLCTK